MIANHGHGRISPWRTSAPTARLEVDERRVAYVQTRFPGWIRQVFADAAISMFVRTALFTIYSPI